MTNPFKVPPLATAGMNDPRVTPWQPGKFIARLQAASTSGEPILLWLTTIGGTASAIRRRNLSRPSPTE